MHELAHVRRLDILAQSIAGWVCTLNWFNPVGWLGLAQMRKLRELACDDLVLASGGQPAEYADVLLQVAKTYRQKNLAVAVGMARSANVENRIMAILDRARSHVSVSRNAARTLFAFAAMLVVLIGSMRLQTQAESPVTSAVAEVDGKVAEQVVEAPADGERSSAADDDKGVKKVAEDADVRTMEVLITDEEGKPLAGARLHVSIWEMEGRGDFPNTDYQTNSSGLVEVKLPSRIRILRLWPSKSGYVPEFVNFAQGTHDDGKLIPDRYQFKLAQGAKLSGTVVNEKGEPISDVVVDVSVRIDEPTWTTPPKPMISTWLTDEDFNKGSAITDKNGKWKISNAPAQVDRDDFEFRLKFSHPDYASDSTWTELQYQQNITTKMLRDGSAKIVMNRGVAVVGTVVDSSGNPVTQGLIIWHDDPYHGQEVHEAQIDETGHFVTLPLPPGIHPITIVAPGHRPRREMVRVTRSIAPIHFKLLPGKHLTLKIVDSQGMPIPDAYVALRKWRKVGSLYNHRHSNVPESGIPRHADEKGMYVWDWAPDDAVTYGISAKGFSQSTVSLIATEKEHVVELTSSLVVSGNVTDAKTGKPVETFRVLPIIVRRPNYLHTWFTGGVTGDEGQYKIRLDGFSDSQHYRIRLEAEGYRSTISQRLFDKVDGQVVQDFSLEPAAARVGVVVDENGKPVESAAVVQATPSIIPNMKDSELNGSWGARQISTSGDGRFELAATSEPIQIRVTHATGFAEVLRQPAEPIGTIRLQSWASLSGQLLQDGKPVPKESIYFNPVFAGKIGEPRFQDFFSIETDSEGRFEFERLPPITGMVHASLGPWRDSPLTSSQSVTLELKPGENQTMTLGGNGIAVTGKVIAAGRSSAPLNKNWSLNYLIRRESEIELPADFPKLSFDFSGPIQTSWFLDPNFGRWLLTRQKYFVKLAPDGHLRVSGVPTGTYDLVLQLYEQPAGCLVQTVGERVVPIEVTESDIESGSKEIGSIEVECRSGPIAGENMHLYQFTDTNGRLRSIQEMAGQNVLLHVWASWCVPCLESMPDLQSTLNHLSDRPITFVGLNVDRDPSLGKSLAQSHGWNWSQNYLGDDSDMARQLAISSVPTYFLIGPDGRLITSTMTWSEMKVILAEEVDEK